MISLVKNRIMRTRYVVIWIFTLCCIFPGCIDRFKPKREIKTTCPVGIEPVRKVLFIGWDGVRTDALLAANTPHLDSLLPKSIYSLAVDRGPYTVSTPGWSTILHGVWPDKHGLTENSFRKNRYDTYPDIFTLMRRTKPGLGLATISNWDAFLQITSEETYAQRFDTDPEMTQDALSIIQHCTPDVLLMHFDYPDESGHKFGFSPTSPEYLSSIEITDHYLGLIMDQIHVREGSMNEEWMVVLTTDHGGSGTGHGGQDDLNETRYVWYVVRSPNFTNSLINNGESVDLLPTMMKWLGASTNGMSLDGTAIY